jgi:RNA polymerase sigma-70 factor (ECF subfamily)
MRSPDHLGAAAQGWPFGFSEGDSSNVMIGPAASAPPDPVTSLAEAELLEQARGGNERAVREIIRRNNRRLFRAARAVVRSDYEAEDVVQAGYVQAFTHLGSFRGEALLSTWLTRIILNEAFARVRRERNSTGLDEVEASQQTGAQIIQFPMLQSHPDPETAMALKETRALLEAAIDRLPDAFRCVFVLRDIEGLSAEETAFHLGLNPKTANTRLFRARRLLRDSLERKSALTFSALFPFDGARCAAMADRVVRELEGPAARAI